MIPLVILLVLTLGALVVAAYLLGFRLGGQHISDELLRVRLEGIEAQRRMHDLTRDAFVAMADHAERWRSS